MTAGVIAERLERLGLELPVQQAPRHPYLAAREDAGMLYLSGKTAMLDGVVQYRGPLRTADDIEHGRQAARLCALQVLAAIEAAVGLQRVESVLRLTGYVASDPGFESQPDVVNAASELLVEVLGDAGRHTRSAIGVAALPGGSAVELEATVRLIPEAGR
ncbi:RidA family protein [soil metagenome]